MSFLPSSHSFISFPSVPRISRVKEEEEPWLCPFLRMGGLLGPLPLALDARRQALEDPEATSTTRIGNKQTRAIGEMPPRSIYRLRRSYVVVQGARQKSRLTETHEPANPISRTS